MYLTQGKHVTLRMASTRDRPLIYQMGLGTDYMRRCFAKDYPNGLADFEECYEDRYFENRDPSVCGGVMICAGETPVGFVSYGNISFGHEGWIKPGIMEIDIWMRSEGDCGKGLGSDAIAALSDYLHHAYHVHAFFICPEKTNPRAIRAYQKAGFKEVPANEKQNVLQNFFTPECLRSLEAGCEYISDKAMFMTKFYLP